MSDDIDDDRPKPEGIRPSRTDPVRSGTPRPDRPRSSRRENDDSREDRPGSSGGMKTVLIVLAVVAIFGCCTIGGIGGALVWFAKGKIDEAAGRQRETNNFRQIGLAMHNYHDTMGTLPPMAMKTRDGKQGLSWRVALLPYLEENSLYARFKLDEAWDHPDNRKLAAQMPKVFESKSGAGGDKTHVRVFFGPNTLYDPRQDKPKGIFAIPDGTANTFFAVEATEPVLWIQPDELKFEPQGALPPLGLPENDYFVAGLCDGSVRTIKKTARPETIRAMVTAAGNEIVGDE